MFKRYPYWGWLLLAATCWFFALLRSFQRQQMAKPASMASLVSKDLQRREDALQAMLKKPGLVQRIFKGALQEDEINDLAEAPFYIYAFEEDTTEQGKVLIFWNSNVVVGVCNQGTVSQEDYTLFRNNGVYLKRCIRLPEMKNFQTLVVLYPVTRSYPLHNEYLRSSFAAADYIPSSTKISEQPVQGVETVYEQHSRKPLFYMQFKSNDIPRWIPDTFLIITILAAILFSITWIHLIAISLARLRHRYMGLAVIVCTVTIVVSLVYTVGLPFHLSEFAIFSTQLYATNIAFPSLGILLIDLCGLLWVMIYLLNHFNSFKKQQSINRSVILLFICTLVLIACSFIPLNILKGLVIDSHISFDVSNFYTINLYTIVGLFTVGLLAGNTAAIIYLINKIYNAVTRRWVKYLILFITGLVIYLLTQKIEVEVLAYVWLVVFIIFIDLRVFLKDRGLFASEMIFWAAFMAFTTTIVIQYFNEINEGYKRKFFAENIVRQRDDMMEFLFAEVADSIGSNTGLRNFIVAPGQEYRTIIEEQLTAKYLRTLNRYETNFYIFNSLGSPLYNEDSTPIRYFLDLLTHSVPVGSYLYFRENAKDAHYYLAAIPIKEHGRDSGYLFIDMMLKKAANAAVYPELLQPSRLKETQNNNNYPYAIYSGRELITQVSDHPFPVYRKRDTLREGQERIIKTDDYIVEQYKVDEEKTVSIIVEHASFLNILTLFSYMLGVLMVFGLITAALKVYFHYILRKDRSQRLFRPTMRKRVHFAMLGIVFISFLIIGAITIWVFVDRYNDSNKSKLRAAIKRIERSIQQEIRNRNINADAVGFDAAFDETDMKRYLADLSNSQSIDINVYNALGTLKATSQDEIYNKLILARLMMPDPYYKLSVKNKVLLIENEQIGELHYLSGYVPIRNDKGEAIGYLNVPYFSSQKELNYQISNILVALINFYAIIFLISSFFALIITNWLTRGLQMIIERFQKFSLRQNEPLVWEHDDEIGLLVRAYNNMVKKVEESTSLLAQSERESAWREMARQVAHEIKNPLTPMKLNIQYLQQALKNNHPNTRQLTENVAVSLIEQIDSLSHIASAFSDFAKMPEAQPEEIILNDILFNAVELYLNNTGIDVTFEDWPEKLLIYTDRTQLLRVLTNLLQNAVEAIPEERAGKILVSLKTVENSALISVADNGTGIPEEAIGKMFSPYFTTKGSGTGLGLAMSRRIIEFWKGNIWFETTSGEGTTFFIRLPLYKN